MAKSQKGYIWTFLRASFWAMVGLWVVWILITTGFIPVTTPAGRLLGVAWLVSIVASFILSLIHLTKHKEKTLAITALVLSSIIIITQIVYFILG